MRALEAALEAVAAASWEEALEQLLEAWRATHAVRVADLVDQVSARLPIGVPPSDTDWETDHSWRAVADQRQSRDLPRLLISLCSKRVDERLLHLRGWDDPRLARALALIVAHVPLSPRGYGIAFEILRDTADSKTLTQLEDRIRRDEAQADAWRRANDWVSELLQLGGLDGCLAGLEALANVSAPPPLLAEDQWLCDGIAAQLAQRGAVRVREEELLDAIYADPDSDLPRLEYANWLIEHGDERGVALHQELSPTIDPRMREQREAHARSRQGPLQWISEAVEYGRGFPVSLHVYNAWALEALVGCREWSTLRSVHFDTSCVRDTILVALLSHPVCRRVRELKGVTVGALRALTEAGVHHYTRVGVDNSRGTAKGDELTSTLRRLPSLEGLEASSLVRDAELLRAAGAFGVRLYFDDRSLGAKEISARVAACDATSVARIEFLAVRGPYGRPADFTLTRGPEGRLSTLEAADANDRAFTPSVVAALIELQQQLPLGQITCLRLRSDTFASREELCVTPSSIEELLLACDSYKSVRSIEGCLYLDSARLAWRFERGPREQLSRLDVVVHGDLDRCAAELALLLRSLGGRRLTHFALELDETSRPGATAQIKRIVALISRQRQLVRVSLPKGFKGGRLTGFLVVLRARIPGSHIFVE